MMTSGFPPEKLALDALVSSCFQKMTSKYQDLLLKISSHELSELDLSERKQKEKQTQESYKKTEEILSPSRQQDRKDFSDTKVSPKPPVNPQGGDLGSSIGEAVLYYVMQTFFSPLVKESFQTKEEDVAAERAVSLMKTVPLRSLFLSFCENTYRLWMNIYVSAVTASLSVREPQRLQEIAQSFQSLTNLCFQFFIFYSNVWNFYSTNAIREILETKSNRFLASLRHLNEIKIKLVCCRLEILWTSKPISEGLFSLLSSSLASSPLMTSIFALGFLFSCLLQKKDTKAKLQHWKDNAKEIISLHKETRTEINALFQSTALQIVDVKSSKQVEAQKQSLQESLVNSRTTLLPECSLCASSLEEQEENEIALRTEEEIQFYPWKMLYKEVKEKRGKDKDTKKKEKQVRICHIKDCDTDEENQHWFHSACLAAAFEAQFELAERQSLKRPEKDKLFSPHCPLCLKTTTGIVEKALSLAES